MGWKTVLLIGVIGLVSVPFFYFFDEIKSLSFFSFLNNQKVQSSNVNQVLSETDQAIDLALKQLEQDLWVLRQIDQSQGDADNTVLSEDLTELKKQANQMINLQVEEFNKVLARLQEDSRVSADRKSLLLAEVRSNITGLTALKTKIAADSDVKKARADTEQIIANFKILSTELLRIRLLILMDNLSFLTEQLQDVTAGLQDLVDSLSLQGKDMSQAQTLLNDINGRLQNITSRLIADKHTLSMVTIRSGDPILTFVSVKQNLTAGMTDFIQIRQTIIELKKVL